MRLKVFLKKKECVCLNSKDIIFASKRRVNLLRLVQLEYDGWKMKYPDTVYPGQPYKCWSITNKVMIELVKKGSF